jgi:short-subunit dehydrogenase
MRSNFFPSFIARSAESVARQAYRGLKEGRLVVVPGWPNKLVKALAPLFPRSLLLRTMHSYQTGRRG